VTGLLLLLLLLALERTLPTSWRLEAPVAYEMMAKTTMRATHLRIMVEIRGEARDTSALGSIRGLSSTHKKLERAVYALRSLDNAIVRGTVTSDNQSPADSLHSTGGVLPCCLAVIRCERSLFVTIKGIAVNRLHTVTSAAQHNPTVSSDLTHT
jgi:hypothetical protein